jgi:hypothetical protein
MKQRRDTFFEQGDFSRFIIRGASYLVLWVVCAGIGLFGFELLALMLINVLILTFPVALILIIFWDLWCIGPSKSMEKKSEVRNTGKIGMVPFFRIERIAKRLPKKYGEILIREINDMWDEYSEALDKSNKAQANLIVILYGFGLIWSITTWMSCKLKEFAHVQK